MPIGVLVAIYKLVIKFLSQYYLDHVSGNSSSMMLSLSSEDFFVPVRREVYRCPPRGAGKCTTGTIGPITSVELYLDMDW